ncbi:MAG TPA: archaetidylserine decarboxylase [bacterium]|nr:archaetidylserine decarboxylase [bacterium]
MKTILYAIVSIMPRKFFGLILKRIFELKSPKILVSIMKKLFVSFYKIDMSDAEADIEKYDSVQKLFCRKLKKNCRPAGPGLVSPVDGFISEAGLINNNTLIQAKNIEYKLDQLLPAEYVGLFAGGWFCSIYLAPYNYHRIHSPVDGEIESFYYQPGDFWPVNGLTLNKVKGLFNVNERVSTLIKTMNSNVCVVKVAAMGVGDVRLSYLNDNEKKYKRGLTKFEFPKTINKLDELGIFAFGSTVILISDFKADSEVLFLLKSKIIKTGETLLSQFKN